VRADGSYYWLGVLHDAAFLRNQCIQYDPNKGAECNENESQDEEFSFNRKSHKLGFQRCRHIAAVLIFSTDNPDEDIRESPESRRTSCIPYERLAIMY